MKIIPRIYQDIATEEALKGLRGHLKRALVVLATGLGKTVTVALIASKFRARRVLFLVHNNFIVQHAVSEFQLVFDEETKLAIYNGLTKKGAKNADIVFATWQTMGANLKQWKQNYFDLVIVDEAHHTEAYTYRPVVDYFTGAKLGITATPDREDEADIRDVFGPAVINITLEEAIARGWLPRIEYHVVTDESLDDNALQQIAAEIQKGNKRFTMAEVNRRIFIKQRDEKIAEIINGYPEKAIVFCASIRHAEGMNKSLALAQAFHSETGVSARDTWNRNQATLDALKNGLIRRVCAVNAFNEGVNVPSVGLVAFCRVTGVLTVFRQQLGRGLRPGKDKLIVLDFVGNLERIQLVLEMMNKISDLHEQYTPREEIDREGYVRQKFEVSGKGFEFTFSNKVVDLMKVLEHCEREFYPTWLEASKVAISLKIATEAEYKKMYLQDSRLHSNPDNFYKDFPGWGPFLGTGARRRMPDDIYPTFAEASLAVQKLGILTRSAYWPRYKMDPRLPSNPDKSYEDFAGWRKFLGKERCKFYSTWKKASLAAKKLLIKGNVEYKRRYKEDPRLPSNPTRYKNWPGWKEFLGPRQIFYNTWQEASLAARKIGITRYIDYLLRYKEDPMLPSSPCRYKNFPGWKKFLGKA